MRKFELLSAAISKSLWSAGPGVEPAIRIRETVAGGNWQVEFPPQVSVNLTATTPLLALKTLVPSALMGGFHTVTPGAAPSPNPVPSLMGRGSRRDIGG